MKLPAPFISPALILSAGLLGQSAMGAIIVEPTSATSTTTIGGSRTITSAINGSDLFNASDNTPFVGTLTDSNITSVNAGAGTTFFGSDGYWLSSSSGMGGSNPSTTEVLTFNFDGAYDLTGIYLWNYNRDGANNNRAIRTFSIEFSTDNGGSWTPVATAASLGIGDFNQLPGTAGSGAEAYVPVQLESFSSTQSGVTNIRFSGLTTYGSTSYVGLAEVRFQAIPEPSALLLCGAGGLLLLRRRR